ncbi:MAG: hypothetical protein ACPLIG_04835 [Candidatus Bathyarchaeales archaeon]
MCLLKYISKTAPTPATNAIEATAIGTVGKGSSDVGVGVGFWTKKTMGEVASLKYK